VKCFIAMAFGQSDTDELYDVVITDVLRSRDVEAVRADRIEHNEDIDDRIIQEINGANFAIADLSYARPSVYYEAGFAERAIPVIYTIRRDHLSQKAADRFIDYRLHFDLQMKNVIAWEHPGDVQFRSRLKARVDHVLGPIRSREEIKRFETADETAFQTLPIEGRTAMLLKVAKEVLTDLGFVAASEGKSRFGCDALRHIDVIQGYDSHFVRPQNDVLVLIELKIHTERGGLPDFYIKHRPDYNLNFNSKLGSLRYLERTIVCSFLTIPFLDVCHKYPTFSIEPGKKLLWIQRVLEIPALDASTVGDVFFSYEAVRAGGVRSLWSGWDDADGLLIRSPPSGLELSELRFPESLAFRNGFKFTRQNLRMQETQRTLEFQILDGITSEVSFRKRLREGLEGFEVA
jgi:hypothetical protein